MPETIRQQIVDLNLAGFRRIQIANGFNTDIGNSIHEWRSTPFKASELPAIIWRDLDEPIDEVSSNAVRSMRQLHCQAEIVLTDDMPMTLIRKILADCEKALREIDFGSMVHKIQPRISRAIVEQNSWKVGGSTFEYYIFYPTMKLDSYQSLG